MNNKTQEALKMAIESMEHAGHLAFSVAIQACKEALEQPALKEVACNSEPVAWKHDIYTGGGKIMETWYDEIEHYASDMKTTPLYTHPAPSQWISVDEKLPEFVTVTSYEEASDDILLLLDGKHVFIGAYIFAAWSKTDGFCMRDLDGGYEVVEGMKVTHWMPLPEAPKE